MARFRDFALFLLMGLGATLVVRAQTPFSQGFAAMAIDPTNGQIVWGSTSSTLYRSSDGGNLFYSIQISSNAPSAPAITSFKINPQSGNTVFAVAEYTPTLGVLWRTTDGGATWTSVDPPGAPRTFDATSYPTQPTVAFNHSNPQTVYYQIGNQLYKSTDEGETWELQQSNFPGYALEVNAADSTRMYCLLLAGALNDSGLAYSVDEGATWTAAAVPPLPPATQTVKVIAGKTILSDPAGSDVLIYVANITYNADANSVQTDGNYYFTSIAGGRSFNAYNASNLSVADFPYTASARGEIVLNSGYGQTYRSLNFGASWSATGTSVAGPYAFDPRNANSVIGAGGFQSSNDGGLSWQPRTPAYYSAPLPAIATGGVISLASGRPRVSPGAIFSIYGSNFATSSAQNSSVPLPDLLGDASVTVGEKSAPLFYVSPGQINAQIPWETAVGSADVVVTTAGGSSNQVTVNISAAAPDILQYDGTHAIAVMEDGSLNAPDNAAGAGTYLVLYLTGVGAVNPPVPTGAASPSDPLAFAMGTKKLTVDGAEYPIAFLGLAPTFVGLGQMNLQVPAKLKAGDHTLVLSVGDAASNPVLISTK